MSPVVLALGATTLSISAHAAPRIPASDDEVVEKLPLLSGWSQRERQLRRELAQHPRDEKVAVAAANTYLDLARSQGDARYAGYAMGTLAAWRPATATTPQAVLLTQATIAQYLHDFDGAASTLALALAQDPQDVQAWLLQATLARLQGRYRESDAACKTLASLRANLYAQACGAENQALRGRIEPARRTLQSLIDGLGTAAGDAGQRVTRAWLLTTLAELHERAGQPAEADTAYRAALAAEANGYDVLAYCDFLIAQQRGADALPLLTRQPRNDAVLLRIVVAQAQRAARMPAGAAASNTDAERDRTELLARYAAAAQRPDATRLHAREHAMLALDVQNDPSRALGLALTDLELQSEPVDFLIASRSAAAAKDRDAARAIQARMQKIGLVDARVGAVLAPMLANAQ